MPFINDFGVVCPTNCSGVAFGAVDNVNPECPPLPTLSEINSLVLMHPELGVGPTDWTDSADWALVLDNANTNDVKLKRLPVVGSIGAPDETEVTMTNFTTIVTKRTYTLELSVKSLPDLTYEFLRKMQCGNVKPIIWYSDMGGYLYGAQKGIQVRKVSVAFPKDAGEDAYNAATITLVFDAITDPQRIENPLP